MACWSPAQLDALQGWSYLRYSCWWRDAFQISWCFAELYHNVGCSRGVLRKTIADQNMRDWSGLPEWKKDEAKHHQSARLYSCSMIDFWASVCVCLHVTEPRWDCLCWAAPSSWSFQGLSIPPSIAWLQDVSSWLSESLFSWCFSLVSWMFHMGSQQTLLRFEEYCMSHLVAPCRDRGKSNQESMYVCCSGSLVVCLVSEFGTLKAGARHCTQYVSMHFVEPKGGSSRGWSTGMRSLFNMLQTVPGHVTSGNFDKFTRPHVTGAE